MTTDLSRRSLAAASALDADDRVATVLGGYELIQRALAVGDLAARHWSLLPVPVLAMSRRGSNRG